jgi:hypothetical protein
MINLKSFYLFKESVVDPYGEELWDEYDIMKIREKIKNIDETIKEDINIDFFKDLRILCDNAGLRDFNRNRDFIPQQYQIEIENWDDGDYLTIDIEDAFDSEVLEDYVEIIKELALSPKYKNILTYDDDASQGEVISFKIKKI